MGTRRELWNSRNEGNNYRFKLKKEIKHSSIMIKEIYKGENGFRITTDKGEFILDIV